MADLTTTQFQSKLWQACVDTNSDGHPRLVEILVGSNKIAVSVVREGLNMDRLV